MGESSWPDNVGTPAGLAEEESKFTGNGGQRADFGGGARGSGMLREDSGRPSGGQIGVGWCHGSGM